MQYCEQSRYKEIDDWLWVAVKVIFSDIGLRVILSIIRDKLLYRRH